MVEPILCTKYVAYYTCTILYSILGIVLVYIILLYIAPKLCTLLRIYYAILYCVLYFTLQNYSLHRLV